MTVPPYALLFPGQGSQHVDMGVDLIPEFPQSAQVFATADAVCGFSVTDLCTHGPTERLTDTLYTQPAIVTTELALLAALRSLVRLNPLVVAGHSVGEYAAIGACGLLNVEQTLRCISIRAQGMRDAARQRPGGMAAVLGLDHERVAECCAQVTDGLVVAANLNAPGQTVISGETDALAQAGALCKAAGAKRVLPLKVSGGFHSALMQPAADRLQQALDTIQPSEPQWAISWNVLGRIANSDDPDIRQLMVAQVTQPVRWQQQLEEMWTLGVRLFVELGPGEVLSGLVKRTLPDAETIRAVTVDEVKHVAHRLGGG